MTLGKGRTITRQDDVSWKRAGRWLRGGAGQWGREERPGWKPGRGSGERKPDFQIRKGAARLPVKKLFFSF